ncbi:DUF4922 domain-containing protein [Parabacteroides distasonis]|uniref:DUF4922 domain-containing protein n=1 Tax=Parabacteroides distasonis TaxID=823 RepID=A0A4S2EVX2_PARDI|nr:DUF4922 domain-containing protein [Parabacteroides distasonis]TGY60042.1 DUF4922 domain-containing protein [Parabacteroides distasonis]
MKPNNWVSSSQATELLAKQLVTWPLAEKNYKALEAVQVKSFDMGGFSIRAQFNPARIVSTGAKVDARSLKERKCFLCPENLPVEQERLPFGFRHLVLCNPYPIFPQHFTIPTRKHTPQLILPQWNDFLELTRRLAPFTVFYNGPRSGASAPDHAHFQAVTRGIMPLDEEVTEFIRHPEASISDTRKRAFPTPGSERFRHPEASVSGARIFPLTGNLRPGLVIQAATAEAATRLFKEIYAALPLPPGEPEPMMNLFGSYYGNQWVITMIPRKRHRPWQYEAEGNDHLLSSPGAADIGGLFITPLEKDFKKINPELLRDVYQQVCLSDRDVEEIFVHLSSN